MRPPPLVPERDSTETILVVDDEVEVGDLARDILESAGYEVITATSGEDALSVLARRTGPVHLVLSDVTMRGMSGVALRAELARLRPEVDVVLTSGFLDESMRRQEAADAAVPFLSKPVFGDRTRGAPSAGCSTHVLATCGEGPDHKIENLL